MDSVFNISSLKEIGKIFLIVITTLLTTWLGNYYIKKRRKDSYRELLYKERIQLYRDIWTRYISLTRALGTIGASLTTLGMIHQPHLGGQDSTEDGKGDSILPHEIATKLITEIDTFISFARGSYILLDKTTVQVLESVISIIEGKSESGMLLINWAALNTCSRKLEDTIRGELGIDNLRDMRSIFGKE